MKDIRRFERRHGRIPRGSVVSVRSDWSKRWPDPALAGLTEFPGVLLAALKFLHLSATSFSTGTSRSTLTPPRRSRARTG